MNPPQLPIILALGTTQTLAWASSYYLPAILADPIGRDLTDSRVGYHELRGGRGRWRAHIGDEIAERHIGLMPDARHHRPRAA